MVSFTCRLDTEGSWIDVPSKFCDLVGFSEKEIRSKTFADCFHPDDRKEVSVFLKKFQSGEMPEFESRLRLLANGGHPVHISLFGALIANSDGDPEYIACNIHHLSKQYESNQQFESLFRNNPHPVYYFDLEGNFEGVNDKLLEFTELSRKELLQKGFAEFIVPEDLERTRQYFKKAAEGKPGQYQIRVVVRDGEERDIRVTKFPRYFGNEIVGVYGILQDITQEKAAKNKLKESEKRWQQLVEQNPQPIQIVQDGKIAFINKAGSELYRASSPKELIGKSILDFVHSDYKGKVLNRKKELEQHNTVESDEVKIVLLNGEERYIEVHSIPFIYKEKNAILTVIHDITKLKEQQEIIGKSLKEKETLLQEIHHRVKNNLAVISSLLELQIMQSTDKIATDALRDSQLRIRSMAMVHEKLYQNETLHDIRFEEYLKDLVQTIERTYNSSGKSVNISFQLDQLLLDIDQIIPCSLIVNEVVVNSYKHAFRENKQAEINIDLEYEHPSVTLRISDNGTGLPEDFEVDQQQSLGMTLIHSLSNQLGGDVNFRHGPDGEGTTFEVRFNSAAE